MFHGGEFLCILYAINNIISILPSKSYNLETRLALYDDFEEFYLPLFIYYGIRYVFLDHDEPSFTAPYDLELITESLDLDYENLFNNNTFDYDDIMEMDEDETILDRVPDPLEQKSLQEPPKK